MILGATIALKDVATCLAKVGATGDYSDWYELVNKVDYCTGEALTTKDQIYSALGLLVGSGTFWRKLGGLVEGIFDISRKGVDKVFDAIGQTKDLLKNRLGIEDDNVTGLLLETGQNICNISNRTGMLYRILDGFQEFFTPTAYANDEVKCLVKQITNSVESAERLGISGGTFSKLAENSTGNSTISGWFERLANPKRLNIQKVLDAIPVKTDIKDLWSSQNLNKVFDLSGEAAQKESLDIFRRMRKALQQTSTSQLRRNLALIDVQVEGVSDSAKFLIRNQAGGQIKANDRILREGMVIKPNGDPEFLFDGLDRALDSERIALEYLARSLNPNSIGKVRIVSERIICDRCQAALSNFKKLFPGISIETRSTSYKSRIDYAAIFGPDWAQ